MGKSTQAMTRVNASLIAHAKSRSDDVVVRIRKAMSIIQVEIEENDGIYPLNSGRLTMAEVCRRAGVHKITLQGHAHRSSTKIMLKDWLSGLDKLLKGGKAIRQRVNIAVDDWKSRYEDLARSYNEMYAIEIVSRDSKLSLALAKVSELEGEVLKLRAQLSNDNVVVMSKRSDKG
ncbi:MAG: hypothetical protein ACN6PW_02835 [Pseudomonas kermanshahensis]|uniref:hypothetical protein n=1 Tax=Pseudomonas kermanshahensis TaxID=2745482 RepID=UPI003D10C8DD